MRAPWQGFPETPRWARTVRRSDRSYSSCFRLACRRLVCEPRFVLRGYSCAVAQYVHCTPSDRPRLRKRQRQLIGDNRKFHPAGEAGDDDGIGGRGRYIHPWTFDRLHPQTLSTPRELPPPPVSDNDVAHPPHTPPL